MATDPTPNGLNHAGTMALVSATGNTIAFSQRAFQSNTVNLYEFYGFTTGVGTVTISIALSSPALGRKSRKGAGDGIQ